jgi:MFS family permease
VVLHTRTVGVVGLLLVVLFLLLGGVVALLADALADRFGTGPVFVTTSAAAVLTWFLAGWFGSVRLRAAGEGRPRAAASAAAGAAAGYLLVPGLLSAVGLMVSGAGPTALLTGPVLSALLAGAVAAGAATVAPHARPPAPYVGR